MANAIEQKSLREAIQETTMDVCGKPAVGPTDDGDDGDDESESACSKLNAKQCSKAADMCDKVMKTIKGKKKFAECVPKDKEDNPCDGWLKKKEALQKVQAVC